MKILSALDRVAHFLASVGMVLLVAMVAVMLIELVARRVLNAPTIWAADLTYMTNGLIFLFGVPLALRMNFHVRIDFLASRFPLQVQSAVNLLFYLFGLLPTLCFLSSISLRKTWDAYLTGELQSMSAWSPITWPFLAGIAIGLCAFFLQVLLESVRHAIELWAMLQRQGNEPRRDRGAAS